MIHTLSLFQVYRKTAKMEINISEIIGVNMDSASAKRKIKEYFGGKKPH